MLTDINDNVPSFPRSSYETVISVLDTGNVLRVMASDPDCDANGDIHYSFTSGKKMKSDVEKYVFFLLIVVVLIVWSFTVISSAQTNRNLILLS